MKWPAQKRPSHSKCLICIRRWIGVPAPMKKINQKSLKRLATIVFAKYVHPGRQIAISLSQNILNLLLLRYLNSIFPFETNEKKKLISPLIEMQWNNRTSMNLGLHSVKSAREMYVELNQLPSSIHEHYLLLTNELCSSKLSTSILCGTSIFLLNST